MKNLNLTLAISIIMVIVYLLFVFLTWEWNPSRWNPFSRFFMVVIDVIVAMTGVSMFKH